MSYSYTKSDTFTIIHARKLASKVATDMHLCAQYYGNPSEERIRNFAEELAQYLNEGYLQEYEFGYQKNDKRIVSWRYKVGENGALTTDDRAGKVVPYVDITGASFFNYLTQNSRYFQLSSDQKGNFKAALPIQRGSGEPPSDGSGYWKSDLNYYSGGRGINRQTFQPVS
jgi:Bacterial HORMA domain family 1